MPRPRRVPKGLAFRRQQVSIACGSEPYGVCCPPTGVARKREKILAGVRRETKHD
jgi:hypothetical protein